jgi:peptide/nickel transport system permease protein
MSRPTWLRLPSLAALRRHPTLATGLVLVALLVLVAVFAPWLAPHPPNRQYADGLDENGLPLPSSSRFLLGTDSLGRDLLSRVLHGTRISLVVGVASVLAATVVGLLVGLHAGYFGGWVDIVLMRLTDVMMAVPALLFAMALAGLLGVGRTIELPAGLPALKLERGLVSILLVIAAVSWTSTARVVRGQVLSLRERPFVEAARALGFAPLRILWRHIFPNVLPVVLVLGAMNTAGAIGLEAGLSYLGIGVPPPAPSWGTMISDAQPYLVLAPWLVWPPGVAVVLAVLAFTLLGQGLQDVLDPHRTGRQ